MTNQNQQLNQNQNQQQNQQRQQQQQYQQQQQQYQKSKNGALYWVSFTFVVALIFFSSWNIGITLGDLLGSISHKSDNDVHFNIGNIDNVMESIDIVNESFDNEKVKELLNIIGIYSNNHNDRNNQQSILIDTHGEIKDIDSAYKKKMLIFYYAYNNNMLSTISSSEYTLCTNGCYGLTKDAYYTIANKFGIKDEPENLFNSKYVYNYYYMIEKNNFKGNYKLKHNISVDEELNDIVITDNLRLTRLDNGSVDVKIIKYTFKLNNNEYYLHSVVAE